MFSETITGLQQNSKMLTKSERLSTVHEKVQVTKISIQFSSKSTLRPQMTGVSIQQWKTSITEEKSNQ